MPVSAEARRHHLIAGNRDISTVIGRLSGFCPGARVQPCTSAFLPYPNSQADCDYRDLFSELGTPQTPFMPLPHVIEKRRTSRLGSVNRRSSRLALNARITLSGHDPAKCPFTIPAKATKLNRHGAAIQLNRELLLGSTIVLRNNKHHTTQASARVVTQVSANVQGIYTYGVEFLEADAVKKNFWGIYFP
ncbi:MAG: PilZ domain-containing protein [Acidobacteriia bacterium]|nr:PilZ domain-containing protein [Terriglobia bacterium]